MSSSIIETMRESIDVMVADEQDVAIIDARLDVCEQCSNLSDAGCLACGTCANRWIFWRGVLLNGNCDNFSQPTGAVASRSSTQGVAGMFAFIFDVKYKTPDNAAVKTLRNVVAEDGDGAIAALKAKFPEARTAGLSDGKPVDAIAEGLDPKAIEISVAPVRQNNTGPVNAAVPPWAQRQGPPSPQQLVSVVPNAG